MRLSPFHAMAVGLLLAVSAGTALAEEAAATQQSVAEIVQFQHALRAKLDNPKGEYSRFDEGAISRMKRAQDNVFQKLDGVSSLDQLTDVQKTDVSNSLDEIKSILLANEGNRLICHYERRTGSNLSTKHCETYAEREANANESREEMRRMAPTNQTLHGG